MQAGALSAQRLLAAMAVALLVGPAAAQAASPGRVVLRELPTVDPARDAPRKWLLTHHVFATPDRTTTVAAPAPEDATPQLGPSPVAAVQFTSHESRFGIPPDTQGAVGPAHVVVATNGFVLVHTRAGQTLYTVELEGLFQLPYFQWAADPTLQFDPWGKRWIATAMTMSAYSVKRQMLIARSDHADPTGAWTVHEVDYPTGGTIDQPRAAVTPSGLLLTVDVYEQNSPSDAWLWLIPWQAFDGPGLMAAQPIHAPHLSSPAAVAQGNADQAWCLALWPAKPLLRRYAATEGGPPQVVAQWPVDKIPWALSVHGNWPQAGSKYPLDVAAGNRSHRGLLVGGWTWWTLQVTTHDDSAPAAAWMAIDSQGHIAAMGVVDDDDDTVARLVPSLAVSEAGAVLLGYTRLANNGYASAAYSWRAPNDPNGTMRGERVFAPGQAPYEVGYSQDGYCRWGDYSATALDPLNPQWLWTFQQYAAKPFGDASRHGIAVAAVRPPCGDKDCAQCENCEAGKCLAVADGIACNDGSPCTHKETCKSGQCVGLPKPCPSGGPCVQPTTCDPGSGTCGYMAVNEGGMCDDGSPCTSGDRCADGGCVGKLKVCPPPDDCHLSHCSGPLGACESSPIQSPHCRKRATRVAAAAGCATALLSTASLWWLALLVGACIVRKRRAQ